MKHGVYTSGFELHVGYLLVGARLFWIHHLVCLSYSGKCHQSAAINLILAATE